MPPENAALKARRYLAEGRSTFVTLGPIASSPSAKVTASGTS
jgi:hypothetical protein